MKDLDDSKPRKFDLSKLLKIGISDKFESEKPKKLIERSMSLHISAEKDGDLSQNSI